MFYSQKVSLSPKEVDIPRESTSFSDESNSIEEVSETSLFKVGLTRTKAEEVAGKLLFLFDKYNTNGDDEIQQNEFDVFTKENNTEESENDEVEVIDDCEANQTSANESLDQPEQENSIQNRANLLLMNKLNSNENNIRDDKSELITYIKNSYSHIDDNSFNFGGTDNISDINELADYLGAPTKTLVGEDDSQKLSVIKDYLLEQINNDFDVNNENSLYSVTLNKIKNKQFNIEYLSSQNALSDEELAVQYVKTVYCQKLLSLGLYEKQMSELTSYKNTVLSECTDRLNDNLAGIDEFLKGNSANELMGSFIGDVVADDKYSRVESIEDILTNGSELTEGLSNEQKVELLALQENEQFKKELLQTKEGGLHYNRANADIESNNFADDIEREYYNRLSGDKNSKCEQLAQFRLYRKTSSNFNVFLKNLKNNNYDEYKALIKSIDKFDYSKVDMMKYLLVIDASETSKSQEDSVEFSRQVLGYVKENGNTKLDSVNKIVYNNFVEKVSKDELKELAELSSENAYYIKTSAQNLIDSGKVSNEKIKDLNEVIKTATKVISDSNYVHDERKVGLSNSKSKTIELTGTVNYSKTTISASGTMSTHHLLDMLQSKDIALMDLPSVISTVVANSAVKISTNQYDFASLKKIVETFVSINNLTKEQIKNMDAVLNCINSLPDDLKYDLKTKINLFLTGANPKTLCDMYVKGSNDTRTYLKEEKFITPVILYNYFLKNPSEKVKAPKEIMFEIEEVEKQIQKKY